DVGQAGPRCNVFEFAVALIAIEPYAISRIDIRNAIAGRSVWSRTLLIRGWRPNGIVNEEKVQPAVPVVIDPDCAGTPSRTSLIVRQPCLLRYIFELRGAL